ncbi:hypothetical protein [Pseudobacillus badius]|uniref:hypothetical protein n=1 Tax=Bacillus badius TaxID=1455 RepID=UPI0007B35D84|nr:hypothetical protein [Bacillus badius]KZR57526.1 hypothetical protein A3781_19735 [Bacillus badius]
MCLTAKEKQVKAIMEGAFIPSLHHVLSTSSPDKYTRWGGNACRQTAIFGTKILQQLLPEYKWTAWDGYFSDRINGQFVKYNHAWIYGYNGSDRGLLVDLSRNHHERLFVPVKANKYPKDHPSYKQMRLIRKEQMNIEEGLNTVEYYTGRLGNLVLSSVLLLMTDKNSIDNTN